MSVCAFKNVRDFSKQNLSQHKMRFSQAEIEAYDRHGWRCHYCNSDGPLSSDHIVPRVHGGDDSAGNIVPACRPCNSAKREKGYDEYLEIIAADIAAYHTFLEFGGLV